MKFSLYSFLLLIPFLFFTNTHLAQGGSCSEIEPFCAGNDALIFENCNNTSPSCDAFAELGPNYDCLGSQPYPSWFYLKIDNPGSLDFNIIQNTSFDGLGNPTGFPLDVDFIAWGPFAPEDDLCDYSKLQTSNRIDCSYSGEAIENFTIPDGQSGEIYVLLITNFDESEGFIKLKQTGGTGTTDCSIVSQLTGCEGDVFVLDGNISEGTITNYLWEYDDGLGAGFVTIFDGMFPSIDVAQSGDYQVTVSPSNQMKEIKITTYPIPIITSTPIILQQCDDDTDGITVFNLRESEISISTDISLDYTYYFNLADAEEKIDNIVDVTSFSNSLASTVFVRAEDELGCYDVATLNLEVSTTQIPVDFMLTFDQCDNDLIDGDATNGIATFDFSSATESISNLFPPSQVLAISYYETMDNALSLENAIDISNYRNINSPFSQQIVVVVQNDSNNDCLGLGFHITLNVRPLPEFDLIEHTFLCLNQLPEPLIINVENAVDSYTYEWRNLDGTLLSSNTSSILEVVEAGDYFVTAISIYDCISTKEITIEESNTATIESVEITDVSENNTITVVVSGEGDYEFALDNVNGTYQDEGFFDNIFGGAHTIYIKDKNGCGIINKKVIVLSIPKFFTPNGDGVNDLWKIEGVFSQPNSTIYIYDKFGKLLKQISTVGDGWDGYYRGKQMPSTDYWYHIHLEDGRVFKGHFSLIRR